MCQKYFPEHPTAENAFSYICGSKYALFNGLWTGYAAKDMQTLGLTRTDQTTKDLARSEKICSPHPFNHLQQRLLQ